MTPENFVYWLQGFLELQGPIDINEQQVKIIKDHIALVLKKETPGHIFYQIPKLQISDNFKSDPPVPLLTPFGGSC